MMTDTRFVWYGRDPAGEIVCLCSQLPGRAVPVTGCPPLIGTVLSDPEAGWV